MRETALVYRLQIIDDEVEKLRSYREGLDDGEAQRAILRQAESILADSKEQLEVLKKEMRRLDLELQSSLAKKEESRKRLYGGKVVNSRELAQLEQEIALLTKHSSEMEERLLQLMSDIEEGEAGVLQSEAEIAAGSVTLENILDNSRKECSRTDAEIVRLLNEREEIAPLIPAPMLQYYERLRSSGRKRAVALAADGRCGGCRLALTDYIKRSLKVGGEMACCESCGAILHNGLDE